MSDSTELSASELISLCARYPDINFDLTEDSAEERLEDAEPFSSPCSHGTDHDEPHNSKGSSSTARTTPIRLTPHTSANSPVPNLSGFLARLGKADLPNASKRRFNGLAISIKAIGTSLVSLNRDSSETPLFSNRCMVLDQCQTILFQLQLSNRKIKAQISNISSILTLAPFTVEPAQQDLWCVYRQKAQLIVK